MLETRPVTPHSPFVLDQLGRLKNEDTGRFLQPVNRATIHAYHQIGGSNIDKIMNRIWPETNFKASKKWYLAAKEAALVNKACEKARRENSRTALDAKKSLSHWGTSIKTPPGLEWKEHPRFPKVEISATGLTRHKDKPNKAYHPAITKRGFPVVLLKRFDLKGSVWLNKTYIQLFGRPLPGFESLVSQESATPEFHMKCPFAEDKIETLYGSGKPDAQFSPLDFYHENLPEAVMVRKQ